MAPGFGTGKATDRGKRGFQSQYHGCYKHRVCRLDCLDPESGCALYWLCDM